MSSPKPIVTIDQGHVFTTSLMLAEKFDKQHKDVLRKIELIINECPDEEFSRRNFAPSNYQSERGKTYPIYNLTSQGFTMAAMGFTGKKAFLWKIAFINEFDRMEQLLKEAAISGYLGEQQYLSHELAAMENALLARHSQWRETRDLYRYGFSTTEIAKLQGKHPSNARRMLACIRKAGIDCRPPARLTLVA